MASGNTTGTENSTCNMTSQVPQESAKGVPLREDRFLGSRPHTSLQPEASKRNEQDETPSIPSNGPGQGTNSEPATRGKPKNPRAAMQNRAETVHRDQDPDDLHPESTTGRFTVHF